MPIMTMPTYSETVYEDAIRRDEKAGRRFPRIISEGDSWFSYPLSINLVRRLNLIEKRCRWLRLEDSGDDLLDIIKASPGNPFGAESFDARVAYQEKKLSRLLKGVLTRPDVLMLSAGGNDIIGEGKAASGTEPARPGLKDFLRPFDEYLAGGATPEAAVNRVKFDVMLARLEAAYRRIVRIREKAGAQSTWIVAHSYCAPQPRNVDGPFGIGPWMHPSFAHHGYGRHHDVMLAVVGWMLGAFRDRLRAVAKSTTNFHVVDLSAAEFALAPADPKKKAGRSGDWIDEIHPGDAGFRRLAAAFMPVLRRRYCGRFFR
jgi:lysophospholipase L1-like esterase